MRIVNIRIDEFGPLCNRTFEFSEALTIIQGENESGKSSLLLFIKFALYGLSKKTKGGSVAETDRAINHSTGQAKGSMTVIHGGKLFRIDRQLTKTSRGYSERVQITDLENGEKCNFDNSPGEFFLGIPAETFENSCGISQLSCSSVKGESLGAAIKNMLSSADESIDCEKALKALDAARIKYLHKNKTGGSILTLSKKLEELEAAYAKAVEDNCETEKIESDLKKIDATIAEVSQKQKICDELASKIMLRSVVKLFDKLHEYESEQKAARDELEATTKKLERLGSFIDRQYVAELSGAKNELVISNDESLRVSAELEGVLSSADEKTRDTLHRLEVFGSLDGLRDFASKIFARVNAKTVLSAIFAVLFVIFAALPFASILPAALSIPSFAVAALSAILAVAFIIMRGKAIKKAQSKCNELGASYAHLSQFIGDAEAALEASAEIEARATEVRGTLLIKERIFNAAKVKCVDLIKKYDSSFEGEDFGAIAQKAEDISREASALCDKKDALKTRISALTSSINSLSSDLAEYNEHQARHKVSDKILSMTDEEIQTAKKEKSFHDLQQKALGDKKRAAERALLERKYTTKNPFDIVAEISRTEEELKVQNERFSALVLAIDTIEEASESLRSTVAPKLHTISNEYMGKLTGGKYDSVAISTDLKMSMSEDGFSYPIDSFSTGTKDAAYLALRLSLLGMLTEDEAPPLLMDETLAMMDDNRATRLLSMLAEHASERGQCVIFCCHDREERLCQNENIPFESIKM